MASGSWGMAKSSTGAGARRLRSRRRGPRSRLPEVLAKEGDRPLARLLVTRLVEAAALVTAEAVAGPGVDMDRQLRVRRADLVPVLGRDRRVGLPEVEQHR